MSSSNPTPVTAKPSIGGIIKNGAIAGVGAAVVNAILYFIGLPLGAFPEDVLNPMGVPITLGPVVIVTLIGAVMGIVGYIVLTRFLSKPQDDRWFLILAIVILVLMAINPFTLPGVGAMQIIFLQIMHLTIGGALIYYLPKSV